MSWVSLHIRFGQTFKAKRHRCKWMFSVWCLAVSLRGSVSVRLAVPEPEWVSQRKKNLTSISMVKDIEALRVEFLFVMMPVYHKVSLLSRCNIKLLCSICQGSVHLRFNECRSLMHSLQIFLLEWFSSDHNVIVLFMAILHLLLLYRNTIQIIYCYCMNSHPECFVWLKRLSIDLFWLILLKQRFLFKNHIWLKTGDH